MQLIKKPGESLHDSYLEEGFILDKSLGLGQPRQLNNVKILIANTPMDTDKIKIYGSRVRVDSMLKVAEIEEAEKSKMAAKVQKIVDHGITCFINRQLIYNYPESLLSEAGVVSIEHADFDGIERLAAVTGGEIASTFDKPELVKLGHCDALDEVMIGEDKLIRFSGCAGGQACTIVLRGASNHLLDEAERSLHDALCVLNETIKESRIVRGGGCAEMLMACAIDAEAIKVAGKEALAMEAFSTALRQLPTIIADNAGLDSSHLVAQLRAAHVRGEGFSGLDVRNGCIADMRELGITEAYKSKLQVLVSAAEAAEMILRVDHIVKAAPRQRDHEH
ncbi:T-complex protein 1 subunit beta [archaeon]|nr:MAG: T-complex protein 1 subunit beta [archaeon]